VHGVTDVELNVALEGIRLAVAEAETAVNGRREGRRQIGVLRALRSRRDLPVRGSVSVREALALDGFSRPDRRIVGRPGPGLADGDLEAVDDHVQRRQIVRRIFPGDEVDHVTLVVDDHGPVGPRTCPNDVGSPRRVVSVEDLAGKDRVGQLPEDRVDFVDRRVEPVVQRHDPAGRIDRLVGDVLDLDEVGADGPHLGDEDAAGLFPAVP